MPHHGRENPPFIVRQSGFQMDIREMADLKRYLSQLKFIVKYYRDIEGQRVIVPSDCPKFANLCHSMPKLSY